MTGSERGRSGLWEQGWMQVGSKEPSEGMEKEWIRPINLAIAANQDKLGRSGSLDLH